jgi:predicted amidohydrolase YtcJ
MLIRNSSPWPFGMTGTDVRIAGGLVTGLGQGLRRIPGEDELDAAGGALLPGLHDHHVHLLALAAARDSIAAGPPDVRTAAALAARLAAAGAALPAGAWLRCTGYHESVAGPLDRHALDRLVPDRPVRVQHRTGALWMVNSAAVRMLGVDGCELAGVERDADGQPTGRLWRMDDWLASRLPARAPGTPGAPGLGQVSAAAAALGVTGFTDATPDASRRAIETLTRAVADGTLAQRLHCMAPAGTPPPGQPRVTLGPVKVMLDDTALPSLDEFTRDVRAAHAAGRPVAVHCVTRVQFALTLAALDAAGRMAGDRIEHGAVLPADSLRDLHGLTVVTQPHFVTERGAQYATDVPAEDLPDLWRLRSLLGAGVAVAAGSDAPFGSADPWHVMRSATRRPSGLGPAEEISAADALRLFLGQPGAPAVPRAVAPGVAADLVLLRVPPDEALRTLASDLVAATFAGGVPVYVRNP